MVRQGNILVFRLVPKFPQNFFFLHNVGHFSLPGLVANIFFCWEVLVPVCYMSGFISRIMVCASCVVVLQTHGSVSW